MMSISKNPVDLKPSVYVDFACPKFKVVNHARISKCKNIFAKGYFPNWSEEVFVIKNTLSWTYVVSDLIWQRNCCNILRKKKKKICKKQVKKSLKLRKSNKMERKECDNFLTAGLIKKA